jgi:hypothetical protein
MTNTREEKVLAKFDEIFVTALSTEYKNRLREWIKYTFHQELQKAKEEMLEIMWSQMMSLGAKAANYPEKNYHEGMMDLYNACKEAITLKNDV